MQVDLSKTMAKMSPEEFVKAWQSSNSAKEVGQKTGLKPGAASSRASIYRNAGVRLKKMRGAVLDVEKLNKIIESNGETS